MSGFLDTGAFNTLIAKDVLDGLFKREPPVIEEYSGSCLDANSKPIPIVGKIKAQVGTPTGNFLTEILVYHRDYRMGHQLLIGMDILTYAIINFQSKQLTFAIPTSERNRMDKTDVILKVDFPDRRISGTPRSVLSTLQRNPTEPADKNPREIETNDGQPTNGTEGLPRDIKVFLTKPVVLPPQTTGLATVCVNHTALDQDKDIVIYQNALTDDAMIPNMCTRLRNDTMVINYVNLSDDAIALEAGTNLGSGEYLSIAPPDSVLNVTDGTKDNGAEFRPLDENDILCEDPERLPEVLAILNKYRKACWLPGEPMGHYTGERLRIPLKTDQLVNQRPYRVPYALEKPLEESISELLKEGVIQRSSSSYNSPLIVVNKKDGGLRVCIDMRKINELVEPVHFPLPRITDLLNSLGQAKVLSSLDLAHAYHQCEIALEDRHKTAFTVKNTKYEYVRVPFGLQSAPGFFARIINNVLFDVLGPGCLAYLDDLILFTHDKTKHLAVLDAVMDALTRAGMKIKVSKCRFFAESVRFLGYKVSGQGMEMDANKVSAIHAMPLPTNKRKLQAFLGTINYYRIFVKNFAKIADPLYELLRKGVRFVWTERHTEAINKLKSKLATAPIVQFPDFSKSFHLHTDASDTGIGAVLMQEKAGLLHPLAYVSKTLNSAQRNYSATKREALALFYGLEQFRHIILLFEVHVYTDHLPLLGAIKKPSRDVCLQEWAMSIQDYDIQLHYLKGSSNIFADTLSRLPRAETLDIEAQPQTKLDEKNPFCNSLREYLPIKIPWTEDELREAQRKDAACISINKQLANRKLGKRDMIIPERLLLNCKIINGIVFVVRRNKRTAVNDTLIVPYIPDTLMSEALKMAHTELLAGHQGSARTLHFFTKNFYNMGEKKFIMNFCQNCEICIKAKGIAKSTPIHKYPIPTRPFHDVASDILGPLRITESGNQYILTFRDFTTRYTVLYAIPHKTTSEIIRCVRDLYSHYGAAHTLLTDNAKEYTAYTMTKFLAYYNTKKKEVAPYHAASNGLSERINREVNKFLRIFIDELDEPDWDKMLPVVQQTINNSFNSSLRETPFYALFGYDSAAMALSPPKFSYSEDALTEHLTRISRTREFCRKALLKAQEAYTKTTNNKRVVKTIRVGQRVFAKLAGQQSGPLRKLDYPVQGPFTVVRNKGKAWVLQEIATKKEFVVHPDAIISRTFKPEPENSTSGNSNHEDVSDASSDTDSDPEINLSPGPNEHTNNDSTSTHLVPKHEGDSVSVPTDTPKPITRESRPRRCKARP